MFPSEQKKDNDNKSEGLLYDQEKYIESLLIRYLSIYRRKENKFKYLVCIFRILILLTAMLNTINLGINLYTKIYQINIGLVLSAVITF